VDRLRARARHGVYRPTDAEPRASENQTVAPPLIPGNRAGATQQTAQPSTPC
jgi:hypothetical protein